MGYIEKYGTGITENIRRMQEAHLLALEIDLNAEFITTIWRDNDATNIGTNDATDNDANGLINNLYNTTNIGIILELMLQLSVPMLQPTIKKMIRKLLEKMIPYCGNCSHKTNLVHPFFRHESSDLPGHHFGISKRPSISNCVRQTQNLISCCCHSVEGKELLAEVFHGGTKVVNGLVDDEEAIVETD